MDSQRRQRTEHGRKCSVDVLTGITVCESWRDFMNFFRDMGPRPENMTIDRIDNAKGYCKENCRWATKKEQARNRRSNNFLEFEGRRLTLEEWSEVIGVPSNTLWMRIYKQYWPIAKALTTPLQANGGRFVADGWRGWHTPELRA